MATLTVRDIDDVDYANLCRLAQQNNRSMAAQVRVMIADATRGNSGSDQAVARLEAFRKSATWTLPDGVSTLDILREDRKSW